MRAYLALTWAEFRRYSRYRVAVLAGVVTNSVFGFIRISLLASAIGTAGGSLAGYDLDQANSYVWLGQALLAPLALIGWTEVADRVRTGEIAVDLARPVDLLTGWWFRDLGRALFTLPSRGLPALAVGALAIGIAVPTSWTAAPLGLASLLLGLVISFLLRFSVNLIAFWTYDIRGFIALYFILSGPLSGLFVPIALLPPWLRAVAEATPFPSMLQAPIDLISGRILGGEALRVLGVQLGWAVALLILARLITARAARRLVVQGG